MNKGLKAVLTIYGCLFGLSILGSGTMLLLRANRPVTEQATANASSVVQTPESPANQSPIDKISKTEKALLYDEVDRLGKNINPDGVEPVVNEWCQMDDNLMLDKIVENLAQEQVLDRQGGVTLRSGRFNQDKITTLQIAAVGFKRVCEDRRRSFNDALKKAENPNNEEISRHLFKTAYGLN
jgi:hypothetical protein